MANIRRPSMMSNLSLKNVQIEAEDTDNVDDYDATTVEDAQALNFDEL